jgi:hypothetical protein
MYMYVVFGCNIHLQNGGTKEEYRQYHPSKNSSLNPGALQPSLCNNMTFSLPFQCLLHISDLVYTV